MRQFVVTSLVGPALVRHICEIKWSAFTSSYGKRSQVARGGSPVPAPVESIHRIWGDNPRHVSAGGAVMTNIVGLFDPCRPLRLCCQGNQSKPQQTPTSSFDEQPPPPSLPPALPPPSLPLPPPPCVICLEQPTHSNGPKPVPSSRSSFSCISHSLGPRLVGCLLQNEQLISEKSNTQSPSATVDGRNPAF